MGLEVSVKSQLIASKTGIITILFFLMAVLYVGMDSGFDKELIMFFAIFLMVLILPAIYLHIEYYSINKKSKYVIGSNSITEYNVNYEKTYKSEEISKIVIYVPPRRFNKSDIKFFPTDEYYFAKVLLRNNEKIILTCLLSNNLDEIIEQLKGVSIAKKGALFASVSFWA